MKSMKEKTGFIVAIVLACASMVACAAEQPAPQPGDGDESSFVVAKSIDVIGEPTILLSNAPDEACEEPSLLAASIAEVNDQNGDVIHVNIEFGCWLNGEGDTVLILWEGESSPVPYGAALFELVDPPAGEATKIEL